MTRYAALFSTAALLIILVAILIGVFFRVMRLPIGGVIETSQFLIVISIFLGLAYVQHKKSHIKVEVFMSRYPPLLQGLLPILTNVLTLLFFLAIMYGGIKMSLQSYLVGEYEVGMREIPVWIVRAFIPIGSLAVIVVSTVDLIRDIVQFKQRLRESREEALETFHNDG
jgi:TRAP-type C4-dicarboxylate transport system permease small subunit